MTLRIEYFSRKVAQGERNKILVPGETVEKGGLYGEKDPLGEVEMFLGSETFSDSGEILFNSTFIAPAFEYVI